MGRVVTTPGISVVIPTFERPALLARCLEGFAGQSVAPDRFEVIVVDDGSGEPLDGIVAPFAGRLDLRLERRPHLGVAAARNLGVVLARAPLLILFDDDQSPLPDMVKRCLAFHEAEPGEEMFRLMRVVPEPGVAQNPCSIAMFERGAVFGFPRPGENWGCAGFWGGAVTCKASVFRYGLFDADYGMAEDVELGLRISRWLPLVCHHDGVADIVQLRLLSVREMARRSLRLAYFHLVWQRNHPGLVRIGELPVYRNAARALLEPGELAARIAALEARAEALGVGVPDGHAPERQASMEDFLVRLHALLQACRATGWIAARSDEPHDAMLARLMP